MKLKQTWRWFGPADAISIAEVRQTGAQGIVSALHHIPPGQVWPLAEIELRKAAIETPNGTPSGLTWDVVESVPVSEVIKSQKGPVREHIDAYKQSLRNLASCQIQTVCYNFMPVLDWTRTDLSFPLANGGSALRFDLIDFAAFDCFILERADAQIDYSSEIMDLARTRHDQMTDKDCKSLSDNIVAGLPGANDNWSLEDVSELLRAYGSITPSMLRANLIDFLSEVVPTAEELGIRLCCHPDDPPFSLLGLPRVLSSLDDFKSVLETVDSPANGATLCTGSLGVKDDFDPVEFVAQLGPKIHFAHLRNVRRSTPSDAERNTFFEAEHLEGNVDMVATLKALMAEEKRRRSEGRIDCQIPMRPDHGHLLLDDQNRKVQPGYPLIGRMRGLAELRGVIAALEGISSSQNTDGTFRS